MATCGMPKGYKRWKLLYEPGNEKKDKAVRELADELGISDIFAVLLLNRGLTAPEKARAFIRCDNTILHDPFLLDDIEPAIERIEAAISKGERITIYGDYDVDGVTSVTFLYLYLKKRGANVTYYIPNRGREGYGVSESALKRLCDDGTNLVITVDTGITAVKECAYAASFGIDMVITDHHECLSELPGAVAVVNPHRPGSAYPFANLAGVGVIFKVICAMEEKRAEQNGTEPDEAVKKIILEYGDLVAIGTIADVMPLVDENRLIVKIGLGLVNRSPRLGLDALIRESKQDRRPVNTSTVGYTLAPRLNAAGRVDSAMRAVELLLSDRRDEALKKARELCEMNDLRKIEENRIAAEAEIEVEKQCDLEHDHFIVLSGENWKQGVIGVVVSRLTETYGLPAIMISFEGAMHHPSIDSDLGKGSGRSVKGLNLAKTLQRCNDILAESGGHELAAGLTVRKDRISELRKRLNAYAAEEFATQDLAPEIEADLELDPRDLTTELVEEMSGLEPFGTANPVPAFVIRNLEITKVTGIKDGKHIKLFFTSSDGPIPEAIWFNRDEKKVEFGPGDTVDVLFQLSINEFRGNRSLQLVISDIHRNRGEEDDYFHWKERYEQILSGDTFLPEENIIPNREDLSRIFKCLRARYRSGHRQDPELLILSLINKDPEEPAIPMNYAKFRFGLRVFKEMNICGISEPEPGMIAYEIFFVKNRVDIEKSGTIKQLKGLCKGD